MKARTGMAAVALLLLATALRAQDHRVAFIGYVGSASYSDMAGDATSQVLLAPGVFTGGQAELWFQRFGFRLNGGFARTALEGQPAIGMGVQAIDIDLMARLRWPAAGHIFQPYAVLGAGAVRYDVGSDVATLGGEIYPSDPTTRGSLVLGIGTDLGSGPVAVRLELMDIIGLSSPLARADGSSYGAVQHVVFTFGLGFRAGRIQLSPKPETATRPGRPPVRRPPPRRPPRPVTEPEDSADAPEPETPVPTRPPVPEPPREPGMDTLTVEIPARPVPGMDTLTVEVPARPVPGPEPGEVPDTADAPERPGDPEEVQGRLFTVRVVWDAAAAADTPPSVRRAAETLVAAGLPVWPVAPAEEDGRPSRRMGALRNAADARALGAFIQAEWGLAWTWVHIEREEDVPASAVEASHAFVDGLAAPARPVRRKAAGGPPR